MSVIGDGRSPCNPLVGGAFWRASHEARVEPVPMVHDHDDERFIPLTPNA